MKIKEEKGSIVLFVLVTCIFILSTIMILIMNSENTKQNQEKQIQQITKDYEVTEQDLERVYSEKLSKLSTGTEHFDNFF